MRAFNQLFLAGTKMFFLQSGKVSVENQNGDPIATLEDGSYFGELALLMTCKRNATVRAKTHCSVFTLGFEDFHEVSVCKTQFICPSDSACFRFDMIRQSPAIARIDAGDSFVIAARDYCPFPIA